MARKVDRDAIIKQIAQETGLKISEVRDCVKAQFAYVKKAMESNRFPQVRLPYFGRFWVKDKRLKELQKYGLRTPEDDDE